MSIIGKPYGAGRHAPADGVPGKEGIEMGTSMERGMDFGKNLLSIRQRAGMTQVDLAKKLGWRDGSRISRMEHGLVRPDETVWKRIAKILDVGAGQVVGLADVAPATCPLR